jgi:hypothetical protein
MGKRKAATISVGDLRSAVDKSVKRLKDDIPLEDHFATHHGVIFGRVLRDEVDFDLAQTTAERITKDVSAYTRNTGLTKLSPAVLKIPGRHIIIGFVEEHVLRPFVE